MHLDHTSSAQRHATIFSCSTPISKLYEMHLIFMKGHLIIVTLEMCIIIILWKPYDGLNGLAQSCHM